MPDSVSRVCGKVDNRESESFTMANDENVSSLQGHRTVEDQVIPSPNKTGL